MQGAKTTIKSSHEKRWCARKMVVVARRTSASKAYQG